MAKAEMLCPFSSKLCKECSVYRGKHYFICYCETYRGYLKPKVKKANPFKKPNGKFDIPALNSSIFDPFNEPQKDIEIKEGG